MPDENAPPPHVVATIGLHGSASTWVFNVVRELMIAALGEAQVMAAYAEEPGEVPAEAALAGRRLVLKSHHGSAGLDAWLQTAGARIVLSVRDPRDAALSMSQRFRAPLAQTVRWLLGDCQRMMRLASQGHPLLRYEDRFFEDEASPKRLADALRLNLDPAAIRAIFLCYRTDAIRAFTQTLADLPPERLVKTDHTMMDRVTQIHRTHIGDARSGKWRDLPAPAQAEMTRLFKPFLDRFGYPD